MKYTITKEEHEKLDDGVKAEYTASGDNFTLKVEGGPDTAKLEQKIKLEKEHREKAEGKVKTLKTEIDTKDKTIEDMRMGAMDKSDVEALKTSWEEKHKKQADEFQEKLTESSKALEKILVQNVAIDMSQISTIPSVIQPVIEQRLSTETVDGKAKTVVLDANGKPSALTTEELKKEFQENPLYASIMKGSDASGGGAGGGDKGGGTAKTKYSEYTNAEIIALRTNDRAKYDQVMATQ